MSTFNGISFSDPRNINLRGSALGMGVIRFQPSQFGTNGGLWASNPFGTTDYGLYINSSGQLVFSSLGSTTILGSGGSGGVPTWSQIFAASATFNVAGTTWTIDNSTGNNDVLTVTNSGAGSGDTIQITNAGTGKDINGTSGTWSVTKLGAAAFLSVATATVNGAGAGITIGDSGANVITIGTNTNTITLAKAATFSSTITVTAGLTTLNSASNATGNLLITDNTITTFGASATVNQGLVIMRSTSITTGTMLRIQAAEGTLTTGKYIEAYDTTGSAVSFSVAKFGATVIAGTAFGTAALTLTTGDIVVSSGKLLITAASNAASTAVITNNTATSATVLAVTGSGVFTGTTTTSFMTVTASGLTTGTAVYIVAAAASTSVAVVDIAVTALTSGSALRITSSTANFTTGGKMIELAMVAATAGNGLSVVTTGAYTGTGMIIVSAGAMTTGVMLSLTSTTGLTSGSVIRATTSTAGAIATNGAFSFTATGNFTSGAATLGAFHVAATATAAGTIMDITGGALTTGIALSISDSGTGITSGSLIRATTATTGAVATNGVYSFLATGAFTSGASTVGMFHIAGAATVSGTIVSILGGAQTTGIALNVTDPSTGMTSGSLGRFITATTAAIATNGIVSIQASGAYTSTSQAGLLTVIANATTAGTVVNIQGTALTTGNALYINATGAYTGTGIVTLNATGMTSGVGMLVTGGGASLTTAAIVLSVAAGASTLGAGIKVVSTGVYTDVASALVNIVASSATTGNILGVLTTSSKALVVGQVYATPAFQVDASTSSQLAGLKVTGAISGGTVALAAIDSGSNTNISINGKGSGTVLIGSSSTGLVSIGRGSLSQPIVSSTIASLGTTQNSTPSAANLLGGVVTQTSSTGAGTVTLPTGTQLSTAVPGVAVGDTFTCVFANLGGGQTLTITGATGSTVIGTATVATATDIVLTFVNTGTNTWNVYTNK